MTVMILGEKVNLETTILLALVVFLLMVGETMPPTPDAIPVLGTYNLQADRLTLAYNDNRMSNNLLEINWSLALAI